MGGMILFPGGVHDDSDQGTDKYEALVDCVRRFLLFQPSDALSLKTASMNIADELQHIFKERVTCHIVSSSKEYDVYARFHGSNLLLKVTIKGTTFTCKRMTP